MNLRTLFKRSAKSPPASPRPVLPATIGPTLYQWQQRPDLISFAKTLQGDSRFIAMIAALRNSAPPSSILDHSLLTEHVAALELGRIVGWRECIELLLTLGQFPTEPPAQVEADYDDRNYFPDAETETP